MWQHKRERENVNKGESIVPFRKPTIKVPRPTFFFLSSFLHFFFYLYLSRMQRYDPRLGGDRKPPTTTLAHFLATTGPEQAVSYADYHPQRAMNKKNLFDRLRKKTSHANTKSVVQQQQEAGFQMPDGPMVHRKYIPLADDINQPHRYKAHQQRPVFYDTVDTSFANVGDTLPTFPTPPASSLHESLDADLPHSSSTSTTISDPVRPAKATAPKVPIRGLRHIQVQTDAPPPEPTDGRCRRCCRPLDHPRNRRDSCPAILPSGAKIKLGQEATLLLALIDQLKQQLAEEQQSRKILEKAIQLQWDNKKD